MILSNYLTGNEAIALVAKDEISLRQALQNHQERYEQRNDQVKAWVCVDHTIPNVNVLEGPLRGMVIGLKDIISMSQRPDVFFASKLIGRYQRLPNRIWFSDI